MNTENVKSKLCFDMRIARKLIHRGNVVCDIKPLRGFPDKTVIVFVDNEKFQKDFAELQAELEAKKVPNPVENEQMTIEGWK